LGLLYLRKPHLSSFIWTNATLGRFVDSPPSAVKECISDGAARQVLAGRELLGAMLGRARNVRLGGSCKVAFITYWKQSLCLLDQTNSQPVALMPIVIES
jgi:hypothetical protein